MTPAQFLARMKRREFAPAYLFLGSEAYERRRCREALIEAMLPGADREQGLAQHDLIETRLAEIVDDARALSLFAPRRVILVHNAEAALPKTAKGDDDSEDTNDGSSGDELGAYLRDPSPGVVLLFEGTRFDFEGEEKKKLERIRKFYSAVSQVVELKRYSLDEARAEVQTIARRVQVSLDPAAAELLVEALGGDVARIAVEMEKLSLYVGPGKTITPEHIGLLIPDARASTIFVLVNALGRRDRTRALQALDTLCRDGEYLPLALAFLSTQFRLALVARESGLRSAAQIQGHFSKSGVPMWGSRAEQVFQSATKFSKEQLERGLKLIFEADRDLRSARPDDRVIVEQFLIRLTAL